ncbi:hypothetical protein [Streptomyces sp. enrichment culture]|uniref:hypothetical protein n=1 Tax=Streptomyces sp. enrichment culture TaxID=1795815 RepID=UPI003F555D3C
MFLETPIYSRLVAERGDIPAQVSGEADRLRRELARVIPPAPPGPPAGHPGHPGQQGRPADHWQTGAPTGP